MSAPSPRSVVECVAPAKLNLALLVGPPRPDGFHEIASLMVPVTLADLVTVEHTSGTPLEVASPVAPGEANLAAKMVRALEARLERVFAVRVSIDKRIPHDSGLGGGSSDAAATLLAVERLFGLKLPARVRHEVAASVGSDVPFFLWPGPQLAMGRGQVLKEVRLPDLNLVVAVPEFGLSTATVYRWRDEDGVEEPDPFARRARAFAARAQALRTVADVAALVGNDLEGGVVRRRPQVAALCERLREQGAWAAAMTGSGAAVFGLFADGAQAAAACARLAPGRAWHVTDLQPVAPSRARRPAACPPPRG